MQDDRPTTAVGSLLARACAIGLVVVGVPVGLVLALATEAFLPGPAGSYLLAGAALGVLTGCLGNWLVATGSLRHVGGPAASTAFVRSVVMDFALQGFVIIGGILAVRFLLTVKFQEVAAFGVTLAGAVLLFRIPGTVLTSRALDRRSRQQQSHIPTTRVHDGSHDPN